MYVHYLYQHQMSSPSFNPAQVPSQDPSQRFPFEISIEACPSEFLKTIEILKQMGMLTTFFELTFKTISSIELFTRVLNREQDEQRVANQLKTTYFHNIRGRVKRTSMTRNQEFMAMKKVKFNSAYHVTLFMKYYEDRIKQMENEYSYTLISGAEGHLHVYLKDNDNLSSMFINEIRDMKKRLQFLEIKDMQLCEKFVYSEQLGRLLNKIGVFNEIWYRGKESTIIFYSEKQSLFKIKQLVNTITKPHLTILKLQDENLPFLVNYLLFGLLKKSIQPDICRLRSIEYSEVEFTQNKIGIVLHDRHELFSPEIIDQLMQRMKRYLLFTVRGKDARVFLNFLKKQCHSEDYINFCYSKKTVCVCINVQKIKSHRDLKKIFGQIPHSVNQQSQVTFNWFHLQHESLKEYCKNLSERIIMIVSASEFHVENFEKLMHNKALKCVLRLKNISRDKNLLCERVGDTLLNIVKAWFVKDPTKEIAIFQQKVQNIQAESRKIDQNPQKDEENNSQSASEEGSVYEDVGFDEENEENEVTGQKQERKNNGEKEVIGIVRQGIQIETQFTSELRNFMHQKIPKFFQNEGDNENEWKENKPWRKAEQILSIESKIMARIKHIAFNKIYEQRVNQMREKLTLQKELTGIRVHEYISFSLLMFESPFYQPNFEKNIERFQDLRMAQKMMICCEKEIEGKILSYPLCSIEVIKKL